jgi:hypothetical protein
MKVAKRATVFGLALLMAIGIFSPVASAETINIDEQNTLPKLWEYQQVIDRVNNELGSDLAFVTAEDSKLYGIPLPDPKNLGSLKVFEKNIREQIAEAQAWNAETAIATANAQAQPGIAVNSVAYPIFDETGKYIASTDDPTDVDIDRPIPVLPSDGEDTVRWTTLRDFAEGRF